MNAICVDDEKLITDYVASLLAEMPGIDSVESFTRAKSALEYITSNHVDIAILDIDMPGMSGIDLALEMKKSSPDTAVVFLTGYSQYAVDAFRIHASGYILKPVSKEKLTEEVEWALRGKVTDALTHIDVKTFGNFDVFVDGKLVTFRQAKCKELLAYLVDKRGGSITRADAFSVIWEGREYDRPMQKQLDVIIRSLRATLEDFGIGDIFEMKSAAMRVCPEKFSCDVYRFFDGDVEAVNSFRGEYMSSYSWASVTESFILWKQKSMMKE